MPTTEMISDVSLTSEQIDAYHRDGYLSIPRLTTPDEVAQMRDIYDRLFERKAGREEGNQFDLAGTDEEGKEAALPQILAPTKYAPELADMRIRANALAVAQALIGPEAKFAGDHAILKPPHSNQPTPWHQDEAYWDASYEYLNISIWVPLQEATLENGCMWFLPGSQTWDIVTHQSIGNDPRVHGLEIADTIDLSQAVACPLPAGGATVHGGRTLHYTGPNVTDQPRRAYIVGFSATYKKRDREFQYPWNEKKKTAREERAKATGTKIM